MFRSGKNEMNNNTVEEINEFLPQASTLINLLSYSEDYGRSSATNMLWYIRIRIQERRALILGNTDQPSQRHRSLIIHEALLTIQEQNLEPLWHWQQRI